MPSEAPIRDVVLLGAGASIAAGFPAANGLTKHLLAARHALDSLSVSPMVLEAIDQDILWLADIQERLRPLTQHLRGFNPENLEDAFRIWEHDQSQTGIELPGSLPKLIPGYQYPRLTRMLALALAYCPRYASVRDLQRPNLYSWLLEQLIADVGPSEQGMCLPTIVTTNYDLLIEFAVSARPDVDLTYIYKTKSGLRNIFNREQTARYTLHYLKLHGSINWWGKRPGFRVSKEVVRDTINCDLPLAAFAERYASAGKDIEMVPPAVLKDIIYREIWIDAWDEAHTVFCTCRSLAIIGYSFSQGDVLAYNMIALGLARSPYLESIVVIDPDAPAVLARLQSYFSEKFIASKRWIGYERRFDDDTPNWASMNLLFGRTG